MDGPPPEATAEAHDQAEADEAAMIRNIVTVLLIAGGALLIWTLMSHAGAPANNYPNPQHSCPPGSAFTSVWMKQSDYDGQPGPGILYWHGQVEVNSCSGVLHAGVGSGG